jgi:hypothetical protein
MRVLGLCAPAMSFDHFSPQEKAAWSARCAACARASLHPQQLVGQRVACRCAARWCGYILVTRVSMMHAVLLISQAVRAETSQMKRFVGMFGPSAIAWETLVEVFGCGLGATRLLLWSVALAHRCSFSVVGGGSTTRTLTTSQGALRSRCRPGFVVGRHERWLVVVCRGGGHWRWGAIGA